MHNIMLESGIKYRIELILNSTVHSQVNPYQSPHVELTIPDVAFDRGTYIGVQYNGCEVPPYALQSQPFTEREEKACHDSLFLTDPAFDRDRLVQDKGERVQNTCEWILGDPNLRAWLDGGVRSLWICGGPGKGKTMMSIFLSKHLDARKGIYYFCRAGDINRNSATTVLRGLLWYLVFKFPELRPELRACLEVKKRIQQAVLIAETLWNIFIQLTTSPKLVGTLCILDGLDECDPESRIWLATKFVIWNKSATTNRLRILVASRYMPAMNSLVQINLDGSDAQGSSHDVGTFVSTNVKELSERFQMGETTSEEVRQTLMRRSKGTFLWVGFAMAELRKANTELEVLETIHAQDRLPPGLAAIYGRTLSSIKPAHRETSINILRWLTVSAVPLSADELATAVHCRPKSTQSTVAAIRDQIALCGPLLKHGSTVHFVHDSFRDYLTRPDVDDDSAIEEFRVKKEIAHLKAAQTCIHALENYSPLTKYAIKYWPHHAKESGEVAVRLIEQEHHFFQKDSRIRDKWWSAFSQTSSYDRLRPLPLCNFKSGVQRSRPNVLPRLHMAAHLGFEWWVRTIVSEGNCTMDETDHKGYTPLDHAILQGHTAIAQFLAGHGATIVFNRPALLHAVHDRHLDMARSLLQHGADLTAEDTSNCFNSIMEAVYCGNTAMVQFLCESGADVSCANSKGETAMWAMFRSSVLSDSAFDDMLDLLLEFGLRPDPRATNVQGQTLLHATAWKGRHIKRALNLGCDITAVDGQGNTALHLATSGPTGLWAVRLLLEHEASIVAKDSSGKTVLHLAAQKDKSDDRTTLLRMLLENGADPNAIDNTGSSPLHFWAGLTNPESVAELLLQYGADIEACNDARARPLHEAVRRGMVKNAQVLLEHGADVEASEKGGRRAMHIAATSKNFWMVEKLLEFDADLNAQADGGLTPLHHAVWKNNEPMTKFLLDLEADIEIRDSKGWTALHIAAMEGRTSMAQLLLDAKADVNAKGGHDLTALHLAAYAGHTKTVNTLVNSGASVGSHGVADTILGCPRVTARDLAAWKRHTDIEGILHDHGVARSSFLIMLFFLLVDLLQYIMCYWTS